MASFIEDKREAARAFLTLTTAATAKLSTQDLLRQYWVAKSGASNPQKLSVQDHVIAAGKKHCLKDVT